MMLSSFNRAGNRRPSRARSSQLGFTAIEAAVSATMLAIVVLSVACLLIYESKVSVKNEDWIAAEKLGLRQMEVIRRFASAGVHNFESLVANNLNSAIPVQPAIPGARPTIPAEPAGDRLIHDFDGDGVADWGGTGKLSYVYQLLIDEIPAGNPYVGDVDADGTDEALLKRVMIRLYYADNSNPAEARVDTGRHPDPGGAAPRRYASPLVELTTYISAP